MSKEPIPDKAALHLRCIEIVSAKRRGLEQQLAGLAESVANETKSTAGDKYETARAMLHIEQDQVRGQLLELQRQLAVLQAIDPAQRAPSAVLGSLVNLDGSWFFLSTGLGKVQWKGMYVIALSLQSPLGAKLRGLTTGDTFSMNGKQMRICAVI